MKLFPIMDAGGYQFRDKIETFRSAEITTVVIAIPFDMIAPHEPQALKNHNQTLERLNQRGGLSSGEAVAILTGTDVFRTPINTIQGQKRLLQLLSEWLTAHRLAGAAEWRCFHCSEVFSDPAAAAEHFGGDLLAEPACRLNATEGGLVKLLRDQEDELRRYRQEDTASYREFYALGADHTAALRDAEQKGYDRGLADARKEPERGA